jgi:hypothetical protein
MAAAKQYTDNQVQGVLHHTQNRIDEWYVEVKEEYGVNGSGTVHYNKKNHEVVVEFKEDGKQKQWSMAFYPEYLENGINWIFDCWAELAGGCNELD